MRSVRLMRWWAFAAAVLLGIGALMLVMAPAPRDENVDPARSEAGVIVPPASAAATEIVAPDVLADARSEVSAEVAAATSPLQIVARIINVRGEGVSCAPVLPVYEDADLEASERYSDRDGYVWISELLPGKTVRLRVDSGAYAQCVGDRLLVPADTSRPLRVTIVLLDGAVVAGRLQLADG